MGGRRANRQGTVYKEGDHYAGQYWYSGKRKTVRIRGVKNKAEAYEVLNQITAEIYKGTYIDKNNVSIKNILEELMELRERGDLADSTLLSNEYTAKIIFKMDIANIPIQKVTDRQINTCLDKLTQKYTDSYIEKIYQQLKKVYNMASEKDLIKKNWFDTSLVPKPKSKKLSKDVEALTVENHKKFMIELEKGYDKYTVVLYILIETGMRVGEVLALDGQSLDFKNNTIKINKTLSKNKQGKVILKHKTKTSAGMRTIPMSNLLKSVLYKYKYNMKIGPLFTKSDGSYINSSTINTHVKKVCKYAGIEPKIYTIKRKLPNKSKRKIINSNSSKVHTHILRHTYATRCIEARNKTSCITKTTRSFFYRNNSTEFIHLCLTNSKKVNSTKWITI